MKAIFILAILAVPRVLWAVPLPLVPDEHHHLVVTPAHVPDDGQLVIRQFASLQHIEFMGDFTTLRELYVQDNAELTTLELLPATFPVLRELGLQRNEQLPGFTIPGALPAIVQIYITYNPRITSLTIPGTLSTLSTLFAGNNGITSLTIPGTLSTFRELVLAGDTSMTTLTFEAGEFPRFMSLSAMNAHLTSVHLPDALVRRSHALVALPLPRTPEAVATSMVNSEMYVEFELRDVTENAAPAAPAAAPAIPRGIAAPAAPRGDIAVTGQEALTRMRAEIQQNWQTFAQANRDSIRAFLPSAADAPAAFSIVYEEMRAKIEEKLPFLKGKKRFRLETALQGLRLLNGDEAIHTFADLPHESYRTGYGHQDPNNLQLFVFAYRMLAQQPMLEGEFFVRAWLAETYPTPAKMEAFHQAFPHATESEIGQVLRTDNQAGIRLVSVLTHYMMGETSPYAQAVVGDSMNKSVKRMIQILQKDYHVQQWVDTFNPLIEALFMTMRGHNTNIELATEPNRTACPDGANLNILRAMPASGVGRGSFASIAVAPCAGTVAAPTHDPL